MLNSSLLFPFLFPLCFNYTHVFFIILLLRTQAWCRGANNSFFHVASWVCPRPKIKQEAFCTWDRWEHDSVQVWAELCPAWHNLCPTFMCCAAGALFRYSELAGSVRLEPCSELSLKCHLGHFPAPRAACVCPCRGTACWAQLHRTWPEPAAAGMWARNAHTLPNGSIWITKPLPSLLEQHQDTLVPICKITRKGKK